MRTIAIDFETSGLDYWSPTFKIFSLAASWREGGDLKSFFSQDVGEMEQFLRPALLANRIVVHNLSFEYSILKYHFKDLYLANLIDTMRLIQVLDNGGEVNYADEDDDTEVGLSLQACIQRYLPVKYHNHKAPYYEWLRENVGSRVGSEGADLHKLPFDLLKAYNLADTDATLVLYEIAIGIIEKRKYTKWEMDHQLYRFRCAQLSASQFEGIKVDREELSLNIQRVKQELEEIDSTFFAALPEQIQQVINLKTEAYINDPTLKTDRGRDKRKAEVASGARTFDFNTGSTKDLATLFIAVMGIKPPFLTKATKDGKGGGSPSFKSAHLGAWCEEAKILKKKGTLRILLKQMESLYALSGVDGRWHLSLRATGTKTGRLSGGYND